jgi:chromosome segregation ATPase
MLTPSEREWMWGSSSPTVRKALAELEAVEKDRNSCLQKCGELIEENAALAAERDRLKAENDRLLKESAHTIRLAQDIDAKWPAIKAERDALREALLAFAKHADSCEERLASWKDETPINCVIGLTLGDCRRARAALQRKAGA